MSVAFFVFHKIEKAKADSFLPSDFNQDGIVDTKDIDLIKQNYANTAGGILNPSPYDLNNDHKINSLDLAMVEDNQGNGTDPDRDWDKDSYSVARGDCDDRGSEIYPYQVETRNGKDDNCNGEIDELLDVKPIASNNLYHITFHWDPTDGLKVKQITATSSSTNTIGSRGIGEFSLNMYGADGKIRDYILFNRPVSLKGEPFEGTNAPQSGDIDIEVPKSDSVVSMDVTSSTDKSFSLPISLSNIASAISPTTQAADDGESACPSVMKGDADGYFRVAHCYGFQEHAASAALITKTYQVLMQKLPWDVAIPLAAIQIVSDQEMEPTCGKRADACYYPNTGTIYFADKNLIDATIAHEFAHHFNNTMSQPWVFIEPGHSQYRTLSILKKIVENYGCKVHDLRCKFDPKSFHEAWDARLYDPVDPCFYIECDRNSSNYATWNWQFATNPATGMHDAIGPRPGVPGMTRSYGAINPNERFATFTESLYLTAIGRSSEPIGSFYFFGFDLLVGSGSEYLPTTTELIKDLKIASKNGLIRYDTDHDGVPDEYDNCAPKMYPTQCSIPDDPDAENACANSDQTDSNTNGQGDKCEFSDGKFFACGSGLDSGIVFYQKPVIPSARECAGLGYPCGGDPVFISSGTSDQDRMKFTHSPNCTQRYPYCDFSIPGGGSCWYEPFSNTNE